MPNRINQFRLNPARQKGALTMISAVLILVLLTGLVLYAVQVGVFEQRKSSNEVRYKRAFHIADSAVQQAKMFMSVNYRLVASDEERAEPIVDEDGNILDWKEGWRSEGRWTLCPSDPAPEHPCSAESVSEFRDNTYFYEVDGLTVLPFTPAVGAGANENVTTHALLCMLDIDRSADPVVQGCVSPGGGANNDYFVVTLLARGLADCDDDGENCTAEALVSEKIGNYGPARGEGGPGLSLIHI